MTYADSAWSPPRTKVKLQDIKATAIGNESFVIRKEYKNFVDHFYFDLLYSRQRSDPFAKFLTLKLKWESETSYLSSITEISMHPAYQQIIGMGTDVIPLIFSEMMRQRGHWFWALKSITGEDPVMPEHRGNMKKMTDAWLQWGRSRGYI